MRRRFQNSVDVVLLVRMSVGLLLQSKKLGRAANDTEGNTQIMG